MEINDMKDRKKSYERQANIAVGLLIFIICGIPTLLMLALYWLLSDARSMGMMGFVQEIVMRICWLTVFELVPCHC